MRASSAPAFGAATVGSPDKSVLHCRGAAVRAEEVGKGRNDGAGASIVSLPTSKRAYPKQRKRTLEQLPQRQLTPQELAERKTHRQLVESLGDGGYLTWQSSPHVMWLARRLSWGGR